MPRAARRLTVLVGGVLAAAALSPVSAFASASVERYSTCEPFGPPPGQYCSFADIEHNVVTTRSGNVSDAANGSLGYSITSATGDSYAYSYDTHAHFLYKDLFLHEQHQQILSV